MVRTRDEGCDRSSGRVLGRRRLGLLFLPWLISCGSAISPELRGDRAPAWPPDDPRIRLERVISTGRDTGRGALVRRLTGRTDPPLFERPFGAVWDGDALLVADVAAGRIIRVGVRGGVDQSADRLFTGPIGVAACASGIVVTDSRAGEVKLLDRDLKLVRRLAEGLERPTGVACDGDGFVVAETGQHRLLRFQSLASEEGDSVIALGQRGEADGEFNFPTALALDDDRLWVGDTLNFRVQQLSAASGEFVDAFGSLGDASGEMPRVKGVGVDAAGQVWVSDAHLDQVALYGSDGSFLMALGRPGTAAGEFSFPAGIAAHPDGRVAVVDSLNRRVQIFRLVAPPASGEEASS